VSVPRSCSNYHHSLLVQGKLHCGGTKHRTSHTLAKIPNKEKNPKPQTIRRTNKKTKQTNKQTKTKNNPPKKKPKPQIATDQVKPVFPHEVAGADRLLPTCNLPCNRVLIFRCCWNYSLYNPLFTLHSKITVVNPNICIVYSGRRQDLVRLRVLFLQLVGYVKSIYNFTFTSCRCLLYTVEKLNLE